ncbi:MAG TPA: amidohydrolase family protein [Chitinophagaceae bacterium]|nr:amidohydrolase family protein [Chitinophagaceae bacterium]
MPFISASFIFDGQQFLPPNSCIEIDENGTILQVLSNKNDVEPTYYKGLLMPGMVNAHCHLELSYMKEKIEPNMGLVDFLISVMKLKNEVLQNDIFLSIENAVSEMQANGIVAVGDICNTLNTFKEKSKSRLWYHSFIECIGLNTSKAEEVFSKNLILYNTFSELHPSSMVLHAPYSISEKLIELINTKCKQNLMSIHNQESAEENKLFEKREGDFLKLLNEIRFKIENFQTNSKSSIQNYFDKILNASKIILVHNTFTSKDDIQYVRKFNKEVFWCLCPKANLYIENTLPLIENFIDEHCCIVLGTDSLASNDTLSIWDEISTIRKYNPLIPIETILRWATYNGALALGLESKVGQFQKGMQPGIVHIESFDKQFYQKNEKLNLLYKSGKAL